VKRQKAAQHPNLFDWSTAPSAQPHDPSTPTTPGADDKKRQDELLAAQETPYGEDPYDPNDPKTFKKKYSALKVRG